MAAAAQRLLASAGPEPDGPGGGGGGGGGAKLVGNELRLLQALAGDADSMVRRHACIARCVHLNQDVSSQGQAVACAWPGAWFGSISPLREPPQVSRLALLSLFAVFKDILPGYRIRPPSDKEQDVKARGERQGGMVMLWGGPHDYPQLLCGDFERFQPRGGLLKPRASAPVVVPAAEQGRGSTARVRTDPAQVLPGAHVRGFG
jgi:hypothetical protein